VDDHQSRVVLDNINAAHDTVVLSMHDVDLALAYTDRVVGLQDGEIVCDQSTSQMRTSDLDFLYKHS